MIIYISGWTSPLKVWSSSFLYSLVLYTSRDSSHKNDNSVINYSPSCRPKPVRLSFIFRTQIKILLMKSESFLITTTFKVQKGIKNIVKIVHVILVVQPQCYEATRILFVHRENKNNDFIQQFLLFHVSLWCRFTRVPWHKHVVLLTQEPVFWHRTWMRCGLFTSRGMHTHASWYSHGR